MGFRRAPCLVGTDRYTRRQVVEQFRSGELKVLVNYGVFREGFDAPKTRAIIVARPRLQPELIFPDDWSGTSRRQEWRQRTMFDS